MSDNEEMRRNWTELGGGWVEHQAIFDEIFAPVTAAIHRAAGFAPGRRVLDVGCGSGTLLAEAVSLGAQAVGVDISPVMVEGARSRVPEATVVVADAQTADLVDLAPAGGFDAVVSRFGVMFFDDPIAAFANLRNVAAEGADLAFACWRGREENPMFTLGTEVLGAALAEPPKPPESGAPGPMAFADPDWTSNLLTEAGWSTVDVRPLDFTCDFTGDGSDGIERRMATILTTTTGHEARRELQPRLGPEGWAALLDDVRDALRAHLVEGGLRFPAACWLVTGVAG